MRDGVSSPTPTTEGQRVPDALSEPAVCVDPHVVSTVGPVPPRSRDNGVGPGGQDPGVGECQVVIKDTK